jgi:hypothetical protein
VLQTSCLNFNQRPTSNYRYPGPQLLAVEPDSLAGSDNISNFVASISKGGGGLKNINLCALLHKKLVSETDVQILNHNPSSSSSVRYKDTGLWPITSVFNQLVHFHEN